MNSNKIGKKLLLDKEEIFYKRFKKINKLSKNYQSK